MASSNSQIDRPQRGCPKRAELPDVKINTGVQSINTERVCLKFDIVFLHVFLLLWALISFLGDLFSFLPVLRANFFSSRFVFCKWLSMVRKTNK